MKKLQKIIKNQEKLLRKIIKAQENLKTQGKKSNFRHIHMLALRKRWPKNKPAIHKVVTAEIFCS